MSFCSNCGEKLQDVMKFCPKCGTENKISSITTALEESVDPIPAVAEVIHESVDIEIEITCEDVANIKSDAFADRTFDVT